MSGVELKIYLDDESYQNRELYFHANIYSKSSYDIFIDLDEICESLMSEALNGKFVFEYLNNETYEIENFIIEGSDYLSNLDSLINFFEDFYSFTVMKKAISLKNNFGVRLSGPNFRANDKNNEIPMLEDMQYKANSNIHSIKNNLFNPENKIDYDAKDIYKKVSNGSLKITLEANRYYDEVIAFMENIYQDIENERVNPLKIKNINDRDRYRKIICNLNDLNILKGLNRFFLLIREKELEVTKRNYLKEVVKNIYNEPIELKGIFENYTERTKAFNLYIEGKGKYSCHLFHLKDDEFQLLYKKIEKLQKEKEPFIKISGNKIGPKTIEITSIIEN